MGLRENITASIVRLIEEGVARGSSTPLWDAAVSRGLPVNHATGVPYSGINVALLWAAAQAKGVERNEWLTFKQAQALGGSVRKGSKGVLCAFFRKLEVRDPAQPGGSEDAEARSVAMLKPFWVFNVADVDGLPAVEQGGTPGAAFDPIVRAEALLIRSGVPIEWAGTRAFYRVLTDTIHLPSRERFASPVNAYAVALHELVHSTGHASRLAREFGTRFGTEAYAFEELVAELGSAMLVAHLALPGARLEHHASYIESWLRLLKRDPGAIFAASRLAGAAFRFITGEGADASLAVDAVPQAETEAA